MRRLGWMQAIKRAHEDVKPGVLQVSAGELLDANANRSPTAYLANPPQERARYKHNTDKTMTLLKVLDTKERQAKVRLCAPSHEDSIFCESRPPTYGSTTRHSCLQTRSCTQSGPGKRYHLESVKIGLSCMWAVTIHI